MPELKSVPSTGFTETEKVNSAISIPAVSIKVSGVDFPADISWKYIKSRSNTAAKERVSLIQEDLLSDIDKMLAQEVPPYNALLFLDKNISSLDQENSERATDAVEKLLKIYEIKYNDLLLSTDVEDYQKQLNDFVKGYSAINNEEITKKQAANIWEEGLSALAEEIFSGGFKLVNFEGFWIAVIDYSRILNYKKYLGDDYGANIVFKAWESDKIYKKGETIIISWDELASRLISIEDFLENYPKSSKYAEMAGKYRDYLSAYFKGSASTPVVNYCSGKFRYEVLESYNNMINNRHNEELFIYEAVSGYLDVISQNNNTMNNSVQDFLKKIYKDAEEHFVIKNF